MSLVQRWTRNAKDVKDRRRRVDETHDRPAPLLTIEDAGNGDYERNAHVLLVQKKRVAVIAYVLPERLSVIAEHDPDGVLIKASHAQTLDERTERLVRIMERIAVSPDLLLVWKRASRRRLVRMVPRDRQIREEESLARREGVYP